MNVEIAEGRGGVAHGLIGEALKTVDDHTGLVSMADDAIDPLNPFNR